MPDPSLPPPAARTETDPAPAVPDADHQGRPHTPILAETVTAASGILPKNSPMAAQPPLRHPSDSPPSPGHPLPPLGPAGLAAGASLPDATAFDLCSGRLEDPDHNPELQETQGSADGTLQRLMAANILGIFILDEAGFVLEGNALFWHMVGRAPAQLPHSPLHWSALLPPEHPETIRRAVLQLRETAATVPFETTFVRPDGATVPALTAATLLPPEARRGGANILAYAIDLSETLRYKAEVQAVHERMRAIVEGLHEGLLLTDLEDNVLYCNQRMATLSGYSREQIIGSRAYRLFAPPEEWPVYESRNQERAAGVSETYEVAIRHADGHMWWALINGSPLYDARGEVVGTIGAHTDISEARLAAQELAESAEALKRSEERYALAARGANDGLWDWDLQADTVYLSPRWSEMVGLTAEAIEDSPRVWFDRVVPEDAERLRAALAVHLLGESPHFECEYRMRHESGSLRWMLVRGVAERDESGHACRIAGSQTDITTRKEFEEQLSRNSFYDKLTGLPNRALFLDRLERAISRASRNKKQLYAVLFVDLDRFKKVNDSLGHHSGDALLLQAGARLESCLRPEDTVARLGGDEFAILLEDLADHAWASRVADRIQREMGQPFQLGEGDVYVTVSIGIALSGGTEEVAEDLLRNADTAMYRAKAQGRARQEVFESAMHQKAVRQLEMETGLWRALERDELCLHYQPIISLGSGRICALEALVRWQHPERGLVPPLDFIPLAEEVGLIVPLGWWVLDRACRQLREWQGRLPHGDALVMSVNLSSKQLRQPSMVEELQRIVRENGLQPAQIKLEITETAIMENLESAALTLRRIKDLGFKLALDDFGTGYSSLSYLHRFPIDTIKIDRSFVSQMRPREGETQIVGTILSLGSGLNTAVIAEGVETADQLNALRNLGCHFAQGYYISKPLRPAEVQELILSAPRW